MKMNISQAVDEGKKIASGIGALAITLLILLVVVGAISYVVLNGNIQTTDILKSALNNTSGRIAGWFTIIVTAIGSVLGLFIIVVLVRVFRDFLGGNKGSGGSKKVSKW